MLRLAYGKKPLREQPPNRVPVWNSGLAFLSIDYTKSRVNVKQFGR